MTDRERQDLWVKEYRKKYPFGRQDEHGIDLSSIAENLKMTPQERLEEALRAREFAEEVKRAATEAGLRSPDKGVK